MLRVVAGQHHGRDDPDTDRRPPAEPILHRADLHRGRPGDDQREDDRETGIVPAALAVYPGRADAQPAGGVSRSPKWVLRTNTDLPAADVALKYKQLWMVEHVFRSTKSILETRPIWHQCDETIRGHVFCSFLALVLRKELDDRLAEHGHKLEWEDVIGDLGRLQYAEVEQDGKRFLLRSEAQGTCGRVFAAAGVALPPTVQQIEVP